MKKIKFVIEYETPPLRGIYTTQIWAVDEEEAKTLFKDVYTRQRIRKITQSND